MNEETSELRKKLGIDDWLELVKEDKNLKGAYICFGQYMDILEKREKQLQNNWNELKKWLEEERSQIGHPSCSLKAYINNMSPYIKISDKMQELEQGKDE